MIISSYFTACHNFTSLNENLFKFEPATEEFVSDLLLSLKDSSPWYNELPLPVY